MVRRAGLSISIVKASEIEFPTRIEAEFYQPHYLENQSQILKCGLPVKRLKEIATRITDGSHITPEYQESGIKFVMVRNLHEHHIDFDDVKYITPEMDKFLKQCKPAHGDILLSKVGSIGVSAVVPNDAPDFNIFVSLAIIKGVSPKLQTYVSTFLNSSFGRLQAERVAKGISQPDLHLEDIREVLIPIPPDKLADKISSIVLKAEVQRKQSEQLYADAENLLASELGLNKLDLSESLFNVRTVSDVLKSKRLDAEHFKQKYYRVLKKMESLKPKTISTLGELSETLTNGHTPLHHDLDTGDTPFLTAEHVYDFRIDYENARHIWKEHSETELKRTQIKNNDLLITIKGRVGNAAVVYDLPTITNINQDVALLRLKPKTHSWYVAGFLNSPAGKALMEQIATGQINPFLGLGNLTQIKIPIFDDQRMNELGEQIRKTVVKAEEARQEAKRLLAKAKSAVEEMIEGSR